MSRADSDRPEREHILQVRLRAKEPGLLMELVHRLNIDFNCGGAIIQPDGRSVLDVFVPVSRVEILKVDGITVEVVHDLTVIGRERMKDVAVGNRFADRKSVPRGYGTKVRTSLRGKS